MKTISLEELQKSGHNIGRLPFSIRILLENALRNKDDFSITQEHINTLLNWNAAGSEDEVPFKPARVLMQDFTGVPSVVDLAAIRNEVQRHGMDGSKINPAIPVDLVVDHSVQVDFFGTDYSYQQNVLYEYQRNSERYQLLKWGQGSFSNFSVVPPGMGICHQVNLEYLAQGVIERDGWWFPDSLVGTDSHTPMVNGIGVLGWGVGGIEAEAAILGQAIYFRSPKVIGLKLTGSLKEGITATDMVLAITNALRDYGVVGDFVEVFGDGLANLSVPDRATVANMSPEFGCTVTYFPIDERTLEYMRTTNRDEKVIERVESYCKSNMLWRTGDEKIEYSDVLEIDLGALEPVVAGPKRPQDKIFVRDLETTFPRLLKEESERDYLPIHMRSESAWFNEGGSGTRYMKRGDLQKVGHIVDAKETDHRTVRIKRHNEEFLIHDGSIVIAAITSCTNTSNPSVMIGAGLVAKKAVERGLSSKPWVKTSLAPGSKVVTDYLERSGLMNELKALRFHTVGYGCTSCIGNSGPLRPAIAEAIAKEDLVVTSILSGNRNFEARVHPQVRMNFLASPMLVVAYALVGRIDVNILEEPLGYDPNGEAVYLKDIWPTQKEIEEAVNFAVKSEDFEEAYGVIFDGEEQWQKLEVNEGEYYDWDDSSTYIKEVSFFKNLSKEVPVVNDISDARVLLKLGDSVTTDHISPAGSFDRHSSAGKYLMELGVEPKMFNSYGSRRGNHEVMVRGTFANVRINNELATKQGGFSTHLPSGEESFVYDVAMKYKDESTPLIVLAGKEYGSGSSRDWAAKGPSLLGVEVVLAESYERIHRSNLIGMGILPLVYKEGESAESLGLTGKEVFSFKGISAGLTPGQLIQVTAKNLETGKETNFETVSRLDSEIEIAYYTHGGILHYVVRQHLQSGDK